MSTDAPTPSGLGTDGAALFRTIADAATLNPAELLVLEQAARCRDMITTLEADLNARGVVVEGSKGQPVASPALAALSRERALLAKLIGELGLPAGDGEEAMTAAQLRAQKAVNTRWDRVREKRGY